MADQRKDLPSPGTANYDQRVRETLMTYMGRIGNKLDRGITVRDLVDAGIVKLREGFLGGGGGSPISGPGAGVATPPDLTPPPTPTGFAAVGAISNLLIECDPPLYRQGHGHGASVLYGVTVAVGAPLPTFADAVELTAAPGTVFAYATNPATTWRLWLKWRTRDGVLSVDPAGGINGLEAKTGQDVRALLDALTQAAEDPAAPYSKFAIRAGLFYVASDVNPSAPLFYVVTEEITVGGVVVPPGVYMTDAFIMNGTITNLKVANGAIDNLKVANVSAAKLIAGSIAVGEHIQSTDFITGFSGWRINGSGTAEFSNGIFRGGVFASYGSFAGSLSAATGTFQGELTAAYGSFRGYVAGGSFTGSGWPAAGGTGFYLGADVLRIGNFNDGKYFEVQANGNLYAPGFTIVDGVATFSGALSAASGTFAGALNAATGTFSGTLTADAINAVNSINVAGNAITVPAVVEAADTTTSTLYLYGYNGHGVQTLVWWDATNYSYHSGGGDAGDPFYSVIPTSLRIKRNGVTILVTDIKLFAFTAADGVADYQLEFIDSTTYAPVSGRIVVFLTCRK